MYVSDVDCCSCFNSSVKFKWINILCTQQHSNNIMRERERTRKKEHIFFLSPYQKYIYVCEELYLFSLKIYSSFDQFFHSIHFIFFSLSVLLIQFTGKTHECCNKIALDQGLNERTNNRTDGRKK